MKSHRKTIELAALAGVLTVALTFPADARRGPAWRKAARPEKAGERGAVAEEFIIHQKDTHGPLGEAATKDVRSISLPTYHRYTFVRIFALARTGQLEESEAQDLKTKHTSITKMAQEYKSSGGVVDGTERTELRGQLDTLNDEINSVIKGREEKSARTPLLNRKQHFFQESIEYGVASGRLSKGEASRLTRKAKKLEDLETRLKANKDLSKRERERLHEEAAELRREIAREIHD